MSEINGMTRAAYALRYWERRQEVVSNNLANADTQGFKAERVFARLMDGALPEADARTDLSAGALKQTGNPLDLAIGGSGFLVVETPDGAERLTRTGSFQLDADGRLTDPNGNALLGEGGEIVLPPGDVTVDADGVIRVGGAVIDRLRVDAVADPGALTHAGGNLFLAEGAREPVPAGERTIRQGYLEDSNVGTIESMVDMISIQRAYTAVQRTVTTLDEIRATIANQIAKQ